MKKISTAICLIAAFGLSIAAQPAPAHASSTTAGVIIHEFYGRGGSAGQPLQHKFVELYNSNPTPVLLDGLSLQYRSATGTATATGVTPLVGNISAHGYFLIQLASNGSNGAALPAADQISTINPSGTAGTIFLANGTQALNPGTGARLDQEIIDLVGYGNTNVYETAAAAYPGGSNTATSLTRKDFQDSNNNATDFTIQTPPTPQNSTAPAPKPDPNPTPTPQPNPQLTPIAEIQGTSDESPLAGSIVTTQGVVTASYPTGGFSGYYIQTPGTGGKARTPRQASDGLFVYSSDAQPIGSCVQVTGKISEYYGLTQITPSKVSSIGSCTPVTATSFAAQAHGPADLEAYEGMLVKPQGDITVTNNYATNQYGTIGLAFGTEPLRNATDMVKPGEAAKAYEAANIARQFVLDDGATLDYLRNDEAKNSPVPYITATGHPRVGSRVNFISPVIIDYRFKTWAFQPTAQVVGQTNSPIELSETRETSPAKVGGQYSIATFNVLNYFTDLGEDQKGCQGYLDREGNPVTAKDCLVRGAYSKQAFKDQQIKIVTAINKLDADVVGLEEIENAANFGHDRDASLVNLVDALNASAGKKVWAYVPSAQKRPGVEDVIRTAFIYKISSVQPVGQSEILSDQAFNNARQPLAQKFRGTKAKASFVVVANHFKSKGSAPKEGTAEYPGNVDVGDGQGNWNQIRVQQAQALIKWAAQWSDLPTYLIGDFNAYAMEDPVTTITKAGYLDVVKAKAPTEATYQFSGRIGSLDHVFANAKAATLVKGATVWDINADEPVALQYSRKNYNVTKLFSPDQFAASDHDPIKIGFSLR